MPELVDDRYELIEVIASGGMATVWRARDTRLDREVAIKRPHPTSPDDLPNERMLREAKAAAAIAHPNLVTVFDAGEDHNGLFMVMELVDGPTLEETSTNLSTTELVEIGAQVAEALAIVHGMGIVHRDVKPSNILMSERGPQLTDFGLAISGDESRLTQPGQVMATPNYAAPEVIAGGPPTAASDVFSLAVTVSQLITGEKPTLGDDGASLVGTTGDPQLDELLATALSEDPKARPDAASFASRLRESAPTRPMLTAQGSTIPMATISPPPGQVSIPKSSREKVSPWWLAAALVLLLFLAAVALAMGNDDPALATETTTTSTTEPPTTTTIPSTTASTVVDTTPTLASARDEIEVALAAIHPSVLKQKDRKSILKKVDEAIAASEESDQEKASKKLNEAAEEVEKKLDEDSSQQVLSALDDLAAQLGVNLGTDQDTDG